MSERMNGHETADLARPPAAPHAAKDEVIALLENCLRIARAGNFAVAAVAMCDSQGTRFSDFKGSVRMLPQLNITLDGLKGNVVMTDMRSCQPAGPRIVPVRGPVPEGMLPSADEPPQNGR